MKQLRQRLNAKLKHQAENFVPRDEIIKGECVRGQVPWKWTEEGQKIAKGHGDQNQISRG